MSITILNETKIFIGCPANFATGGPESLHMLAINLKNIFNCQVFMYYYNFNKKKFKTPMDLKYKKYNIPYVINIDKKDDNSNNLLIVTEINSALRHLVDFKNIRKCVWILSVDNYYLTKMNITDFFFQRAINKILCFIGFGPLFDISSEKNIIKLSKKYNYKTDYYLSFANYYIVNSYRGMKWFNELKPLYYLFGYINTEFLKTKTDLSLKENIVAYNPLKGIAFTKKIIYNAKHIQFVAIKNMSREEVIKTLQKAKVYIDFGNHPGKDRMPREAAILGCCVITGKRGSAEFFEDVSIPEDYKFEDKVKNIPCITSKIQDCLVNYQYHYNNFEYYKKTIQNEPNKFIEDLNKIFRKEEK